METGKQAGTGPVRAAILLVLAVVALVAAMLSAPVAAQATPPILPPQNNGEWDGGPYGHFDPFVPVYSVLEMPNGDMFSAGNEFAMVRPPANTPQSLWGGAGGKIIYSAAIQPGGGSNTRIIVVGRDTVGTTAFMARLLYNSTAGTLTTDATFTPDGVFEYSVSDANLRKVRVLADGSILVGGAFDSVKVGGTPNSISGLAKFSADGILDTSWKAGSGAGDFQRVTSFDVNSTTGTITASGVLSVGVTGSKLRRYDAAGALDNSFRLQTESWGPWAVSFTEAVRVLSDGKVLVGADVSVAPSGPSTYRVNLDGSMDSSYVGGFLTNNHIFDFWEMSSGKYLVAGPTSVQRLHSDGSVDLTWTCGGVGNPTPGSGCGTYNNYPNNASTGDSYAAMEMTNGRVLIGHDRGTWTLVAVGTPKVTNIGTSANPILRIESYADINGSTKVLGGGTKLLGYVIQYNNAARLGQTKPYVIWARFVKPPTSGTTTTVNISANQVVATCQSNLIVAGKPNPSCFRNSEIDNNSSSPRTYRVFTMFQDNGAYPLSPLSIYSPTIAGNPVTITP